MRVAGVLTLLITNSVLLIQLRRQPCLSSQTSAPPHPCWWMEAMAVEVLWHTGGEQESPSSWQPAVWSPQAQPEDQVQVRAQEE